MKSLKLLLLAGLLSSIFYACGSDGSDDPNPNPNPNPTPTPGVLDVDSSLRANTWSIVELATVDSTITFVGIAIGQTDPDTNITINDFTSSLACRADDNATFTNTSTFSINDVGTQCDPSQVESTGVAASGTWSLNSGETQLTLDFNNANTFFVLSQPFGLTGNRALFPSNFDFAYDLGDEIIMDLISGDENSDTLVFQFRTMDMDVDVLGGDPITQIVEMNLTIAK